MTSRDKHTIDLFAFMGADSAERLARDWPDPGRFPLNVNNVSVSDVVLRDLSSSETPLLVTGFAALDNLINFIADADSCTEVRVVFGAEPFPSRRDVFSLKDYDLPSEIQEYWLERGISIRLSAKIIKCLRRLEDGTLLVRCASQAGHRLHAKIYAGKDAVTLGSSNFTEPGFSRQLEANVRFRKDGAGPKAVRQDERRRYDEAVQIAEQYWNLGKDYNKQLIDLLNQLLRLVPWQEALARAAAELLEGEWAQRFLRGEYLPGDASLWPSQRQGIAQALYILKERGSVLVADATGSGKTRAGVHLIGAKMHEIITSNRLRQGKALLVCPPAVIGAWERESALAGVAVEAHSHGALSHTRSAGRENLVLNLRRAQLLCVDEGHNFLNFASNRTQQLLRNMADHVALFTATPINRSATDLLHIADMLGADNLDQSTIDAFGKMLSVRSIPRSLSEEEIAQLRSEIAKFTVRRTKRMLNDLIARDPEAYRDRSGRLCRFPKHNAKTYRFDEPAEDREKADRIRALAGTLNGVLYFHKEIVLPKVLQRRGVTEERYLQGRLAAATKLSQYLVMSSLRSSRAALFEHLEGHEAAAKRFDITAYSRRSTSGNVVDRIRQRAGHPPRSRLKIELPVWLQDAGAHRQACEHDATVYGKIARLAEGISSEREERKANHLARLSQRYDHILAFDSRPITLALIARLLEGKQQAPEVMVATGDAGSDREDLLARFSPLNDTPGKVVGLCSDSVSEGVNLQRAQVVVHLDMPSVVRIAEQRVGRVDRLDSPYDKIYAWWPDDAPEFALRTDERFIERYETVDNLLGSNMPLPERVREKSATVTAHNAIADFNANAGVWDGIDDAFSPVRRLVDGGAALIEPAVYADYRRVKARVVAHVSLVAAKLPWAFFCTRDESDVPKWIFLRDRHAEPETDLDDICEALRERLGPEVENIDGFTPAAEAVLDEFLIRMMSAERYLLSRRKRRALEEMDVVIERFVESAARKQDQQAVEMLSKLLGILRRPSLEYQPNWEEVAARWLDLIRPVWYERLHERGRHKPLLLKDIRKSVIDSEQQLLPRLLHEFAKEFPRQRPLDERIVACIIGLP